MEEVMRSKSQFPADVEHEIEHSRVPLSEVTGLSDTSEDNIHDELNRENREVFEELINDPQWTTEGIFPFFVKWPSTDWRLGRRIAKGGQAEIFEVADTDGKVFNDSVLKVFKRGSRLSALKEQWPAGVLRYEVAISVPMNGVMLDDGRFAFLLVKCWGDLRTLIDQAMREKNNQGPPFPYEWDGKIVHAKEIVQMIAKQMDNLHEHHIIHRDLKAANILVQTGVHMFFWYVADFECSIGVVGTGFWRAPEILKALKEGGSKAAMPFSEKADVYSFGMTCYEVVTGHLPFAGDCKASRDLVIDGRRPKLPSDLDVEWKKLIEGCWNPIPNDRPSFKEIVIYLELVHALKTAVGKLPSGMVVPWKNLIKGTWFPVPNDFQMIGESSNFHTAQVEECLPSEHGARSGPGPSMEQKSEYSSARVEEMMRSKSQFSSDVEHEIQHSRVHWSEMTDPLEENDHEQEVSRENRQVFAELAADLEWKYPEGDPFFLEWPLGFKLGSKIAEGRQAEIYEWIESTGDISSVYVLKVFKRGLYLSDLKKQWPHGILRRVEDCIARFGLMLDDGRFDGRFAFAMVRCWGDLRKLIDQAMEEKNNRGPPFPYKWNGETLHAERLMLYIAYTVAVLHKQNVFHRDLKAANFLLGKRQDRAHLYVADFECSIGVVGTGFWRAPEILLALKNRSAIEFNEKADVYSYGMTCFEVVTGRLPFEGELEYCRASRDLVIAGQRPTLPSDLDVVLKDLIESCWNPNPNERPSFIEILRVLLPLSRRGSSGQESLGVLD